MQVIYRSLRISLAWCIINQVACGTRIAVGKTEHPQVVESEIEDGEMLSSCICKVAGKVYNLTEAGAFFFKRPLSFTETKMDYFYLVSVCLPFDFFGSTSDQPICTSASLCQLTEYSRKTQDGDPVFHLVTTQEYKDGKIKCSLNKTSGQVKWSYKGVAPWFESGGLVLTLNCPKQGSKPKIEGIRDVDRRHGNPWKYVRVSHKCCCADACFEKPWPGPTAGPLKPNKPEEVALEIGEFGGSFFILVCLLFVGVKVINRFYYRQPLINSAGLNYNTFQPALHTRGRIIAFNDISDIVKVGEGSFGVVSKGTWNGSDVAVKRFKDHVIEDDAESFSRESTWLSKLSHKNIVQFYGVCNVPPNLCIITEYMRKGSVGSIIHERGETLDWSKRIKWGQDAARGMIHLHKHAPQIIHRDLKSYNLLVDEHEVVKIGDLGTIKLVSGRMMTINRQPEQLENSDTSWAGTLRWTAPEVIPIPNQRNSIEYTTKSDVFSFAMTFWEMVYNRHPYHDLQWDHEIIDAIKKGKRPDLLDCPESIVTLLESWWHTNPNERPEFMTILGQLTSETLQRSVTSTRPSTV